MEESATVVRTVYGNVCLAIPLLSTLSSKVARKQPSGFCVAAVATHACDTLVSRACTDACPSPQQRTWIAFFTWPRMPDTVRMAAPSKRATSSADVNMFRMNAVFWRSGPTERRACSSVSHIQIRPQLFSHEVGTLCTSYGSPVSLSFFTSVKLWSSSRTTPVALTRKPGCAQNDPLRRS